MGTNYGVRNKKISERVKKLRCPICGRFTSERILAMNKFRDDYGVQIEDNMDAYLVMQSKVKELEAENERLRDALKWYNILVQRLCDEDSLVWTDALQDAKEDEGQRARDALKRDC